MTTARWVAAAAVFGSVLAFPDLARAQSQGPEEPKQFESSAGLKLLVGGNVWSKPSEIPKLPTGAEYEGLGFAGDGGGFGWGAMAYYEARIAQHLGLEGDLGYDNSSLRRDVTYNGVIDTTEKVTTSSLRFGLLVKGILPTSFGRVWAGLGPEWVSPMSTSSSIEVKDNIANKDQIEGLIHADSKTSTMLTMAFGVAIHIGDKLEIPIDLRAAKNLSQDEKWEDRVKVEQSGNYYVTAQNSWDFRLATGLGYRF